MSGKKVLKRVFNSRPSRVAPVDATVKGLASAYVNEMYTTIKNGKIEKYRVNLQMTFEVMPPKADDKAKRAKKK